MIPGGAILAQRGGKGLGTVPKFPVITGSASVSVQENTAAVGTYTADEAVTWSLAGTDAARFTISTGGVLSFVAAPDFEAPSDANGDNVYLVTVRAVNASEGNMSSLNVIVTVLDVAVEGPVITGSSTPSINENTTAVFTYTADRTVTWSINGGADAAKFTINSSGLLSFITAPDFEAPSDADINNIYVVGVCATDTLSRATTLMVAVTVLDVAVELVPGQAAYTSAGTYSWIVPPNVTSICVVTIGGGGGGSGIEDDSSYAGGGGGGGALSYTNAISVTPGGSFTVIVGAGGTGNYSYGNAGGTSAFISPSTGTLVQAYGGNSGGPYNNGGSGGSASNGLGAVKYSGGNAGSGGYQEGTGGGGAAGYTGNGGNGGSYWAAPTAGAAGGGSGAFSGSGQWSGGGGGGASLLGGTVTPGSATQVGRGGPGAGSNGGSAFTSGANGGAGGAYGGGGGGARYFRIGGSGGVGGVRLMWGAGRAYPSTNAGDV